MSTGTNKERLEQNNIKLEEIKGKIDKLPEYQDIEPVYAVTDFCTVKLNHPIYGETMSTADYFVYETWVLARFNAQSMAENSIFRIVNGEAEFVADVTFTDMSSITRVFSFGCIFKFENNKLYIFKQIGETTSSTRLFYSFDITTKELSKLNLTCSWLYRPMWCYNGNILSTSDSQQLVLYDPINGNEQRYYPAKNSNNYNSIPSNQYANVLNMYLRIMKSGNTAYFSLYGKDVTDIYTYNGTPCFITNDNVICLSTKSGYRCYNLNANHTLGTEVNLDCSALSGTNFLVLNDKYILSSDNGKLYEYTSTGFLLVQTFPSSNTYYRFGTINANGYLYIFNRGTKIVGYIYDDAYINNKIPFIASSSNVLQGVNLINQDYTLLTGTMPNNGELNYTPSTEEQTIPVGYTSGGIIAASPVSQEEYDKCVQYTSIITTGRTIEFLNYIKSSGSQRIDLGIKYTPTTKIVLDIEPVGSRNWQMFMSDGGNNDSHLFALQDCTQNNGGGFDVWLNNETVRLRYNINQRLTIVFDRNKFYINNTLYKTFNLDTWDIPNNITLFNNSTMSLYNCKVYDNDILIMDLHPAVDTLDNNPTLFDIVSNNFISNSGTGKFIGG